MILPDLLRARAEEQPHFVALRLGSAEALTYGAWDARSNTVARALVDGGVQRGDRVALAMGNDRMIDYAIAYVAVLKAGGVAVPLGTRFAGPERERIVAHAGPVRLVEDFGALESHGSSEPFQCAVEQGDLAEIVYTSGTTGTPKGVACTHRDLMAHDVPADATAVDATAAGPVSFLHAFPIGTQAAQEALRVPLRIGGRCAVAMPAFDADEAGRLIEQFRVVRLQLVPAMAHTLVASAVAERYDLSSVRRVILSSAAAPPVLFEQLARAFPGASLWNAYALTEAGPARTLTEWDPARPSAVGKPVGDSELRIVEGEVWLRRRGTPSRSYYNDPEATAAVFVDGWTRTGDLGFVDGEGCLHLTGRAKDLIISGGANVSPLEIENVLSEHPAVAEAAVFGVAHPVLGEDVAAAVVVRAPTPARELQEFVRAHLAEHKVPHRLELVDALPRNASGKVVKAELRARFGHAVSTASTVPAAPATETETVVASVWEAVLARSGVGRDDDFFALGGHSLAATQIVARLRERLAVDLPVATVFESPTVAELARAVDAAAAIP